jgi:hypothetical protein
MSPKQTLRDIARANASLGIEIVKRSEIPSPKNRGRSARVAKLTIAKKLTDILVEIKDNGIGVSEEAFGLNLEAPATQKEAKDLGIKKLAGSFFAWVNRQIKEMNLTEEISVVRREGGKKSISLDRKSKKLARANNGQTMRGNPGTFLGFSSISERQPRINSI